MNLCRGACTSKRKWSESGLSSLLSKSSRCWSQKRLQRVHMKSHPVCLPAGPKSAHLLVLQHDPHFSPSTSHLCSLPAGLSDSLHSSCLPACLSVNCNTYKLQMSPLGEVDASAESNHQTQSWPVNLSTLSSHNASLLSLHDSRFLHSINIRSRCAHDLTNI